jgi:hypothetical protein
MEYLNNIMKLLKDNKWSSIFIVFSIAVAYSIGKQYAKKQIKEDFMDDLDAYADKKPALIDLPKKPKKKKIIASASCPEMPDLNKYILKTELPNLNDYVHKSLVPDLKNYLSKNFIRQNFVSKTKLNEEYMLKSECNKEEESIEEESIEEDVKKKKIIISENEPVREKPNNLIIPEKKMLLKTDTIDKQNCIITQQKLDDNKKNLDDNYSYIEDAFTNCNMRTCPINQKQTGLFGK